MAGFEHWLLARRQLLFLEQERRNNGQYQNRAENIGGENENQKGGQSAPELKGRDEAGGDPPTQQCDGG